MYAARQILFIGVVDEHAVVFFLFLLRSDRTLGFNFTKQSCFHT